MHIVIDLVLLAIVIICVWSGYKKGFIIGIANLVGIIVALRHEFCVTCYTTVGIYDDAADQMATEAEQYADSNSVQISDAIIEIFCQRAAYVAGVALFFLIFLIALMAIANIPNLSYRIPNMDLLNDIGGAAMGLINGVCYCMLIAWVLRFLGLIIGVDTFGSTLLARFFHTIDLLTVGVGI